MRVCNASFIPGEASAPACSLARRSARSSSDSAALALACFMADCSKVESPSPAAFGVGAAWRTARKAEKSAAVWYVPAPNLCAAVGYRCCEPTVEAPAHRDPDAAMPPLLSAPVDGWAGCQPGLPMVGPRRWELTGAALVTSVVSGSAPPDPSPSPAKSICTRGPGVRNGARAGWFAPASVPPPL